MRKNHSNNNLAKWILLLVIIAGIFVITSTAKINAQEKKNQELGIFLDPFTLKLMSLEESRIGSSAPVTLTSAPVTLTSAPVTLKSAPVTLTMMPSVSLYRSSAPEDQVSTIRQWIRIPYRPPLRSPYLPN